jgi:hypothetical protein
MLDLVLWNMPSRVNPPNRSSHQNCAVQDILIYLFHQAKILPSSFYDSFQYPTIHDNVPQLVSFLLTFLPQRCVQYLRCTASTADQTGVVQDQEFLCTSIWNITTGMDISWKIQMVHTNTRITNDLHGWCFTIWILGVQKERICAHYMWQLWSSWKFVCTLLASRQSDRHLTGSV